MLCIRCTNRRLPRRYVHWAHTRVVDERRRGASHNGRVILVTGILIAMFIVPDAWTVPAIAVAVVLEASETLFTFWWSRRAPPKVGPETLIGATGRVVEPLRPVGRVRVRGEVWQARSEHHLEAGARVRVRGRHRLTLDVDRHEEG